MDRAMGREDRDRGLGWVEAEEPEAEEQAAEARVLVDGEAEDPAVLVVADLAGRVCGRAPEDRVGLVLAARGGELAAGLERGAQGEVVLVE